MYITLSAKTNALYYFHTLFLCYEFWGPFNTRSIANNKSTSMALIKNVIDTTNAPLLRCKRSRWMAIRAPIVNIFMAFLPHSSFSDMTCQRSNTPQASDFLILSVQYPMLFSSLSLYICGLENILLYWMYVYK